MNGNGMSTIGEILLLPPKCVCLLAAALGWLLEAAAPCAAMEWEKTKTSLTLRDGQRVVWRFSAGPEAGKPYLHPVSLPDGTVATDHRPADHKWHLGVWFTFNKLNGVNFWGESDDGRIWGPGRVKVEKLAFEPRDDFSATISITLAYCKGEERLLTERRTYEIAPPGERANTITARHEFTAVGDVVIDRYEYGGTVFRPAPDLMRWRWVVAPPFPGQRPFDFPDRFPQQYAKIKNLVRPPAKWMAIVERPEGEPRDVSDLASAGTIIDTFLSRHPDRGRAFIYNDLENYKTEKLPQHGYVHQPDLGVLLEITPDRAKLVNDTIWEVVSQHPYCAVN